MFAFAACFGFVLYSGTKIHLRKGLIRFTIPMNWSWLEIHSFTFVLKIFYRSF
jgi:hypothetical protein